MRMCDIFNCSLIPYFSYANPYLGQPEMEKAKLKEVKNYKIIIDLPNEHKGQTNDKDALSSF